MATSQLTQIASTLMGGERGIEELILAKEHQLKIHQQSIENEERELTKSEKAIKNLENALPGAKHALDIHKRNLEAVSRMLERNSNLLVASVFPLEDEEGSKALCQNLRSTLARQIGDGARITTSLRVLAQKGMTEAAHTTQKLEAELQSWRFLRDVHQKSLDSSRTALEEMQKQLFFAKRTLWRVPPDVWVDIFRWRVQGDLDEFYATPDTRPFQPTVMILSKVCRLWREIIEQEPELWSHIAIHPCSWWSHNKTELLKFSLNMAKRRKALICNLSQTLQWTSPRTHLDQRHSPLVQRRSARQKSSNEHASVAKPDEISGSYDITLVTSRDDSSITSRVITFPFRNPNKLTLINRSKYATGYCFSSSTFFPSVTSILIVDQSPYLLDSLQLSNKFPNLIHLSFEVQTFSYPLSPHLLLPSTLQVLHIRQTGSSCPIPEAQGNVRLPTLRILGITPPALTLFQGIEAPSIQQLILYGPEWTAISPPLYGSKIRLQSVKILEFRNWAHQRILSYKIMGLANTFRRWIPQMPEVTSLKFVDSHVHGAILLNQLKHARSANAAHLQKLKEITLDCCSQGPGSSRRQAPSVTYSHPKLEIDMAASQLALTASTLVGGERGIKELILTKELQLKIYQSSIKREEEELRKSEKSVKNLEKALPEAKRALDIHKQNLEALCMMRERTSNLGIALSFPLEEDTSSKGLCQSLQSILAKQTDVGVRITDSFVKFARNRLNELSHLTRRLEAELQSWRFSRDVHQKSLASSRGALEGIQNDLFIAKRTLWKVPPDVWVDIFRWRIQGDLDEFYTTPSTRPFQPTVMILSKVCRLWREIINQEPDLWSYIAVHPYATWSQNKTELLKFSLGAAKRQKLLICNLSQSLKWDSMQSTARGSLIRRKSATLHPSTEQACAVGSDDISGSYEIILVAASDDSPTMSRATTLPFQNPHKLTLVNQLTSQSTFRCGRFLSLITPFSNVSSIEIIDPSPQSLDSLVLLSRFPNLIQLSLEVESFTYTFNPQLLFPSTLQVLRIRHTGVDNFPTLQSDVLLPHLRVLGITPLTKAIFEGVKAHSVQQLTLYGPKGTALVPPPWNSKIRLQLVRILEFLDWARPRSVKGQAGCEVVDAFCGWFPQMPEVTSLKFVDSYVDGERLLNHLKGWRDSNAPHIQKLKEITLDCCSGITRSECEELKGSQFEANAFPVIQRAPWPSLSHQM
ncbi:hypothetical protein FRC17_002572 [Serendipita sp. 399]|nr:hypothetical protein FRC17_002572 [Serendipita sp. 399]